MASGVAVVSTAATVMGQRQWCLLGARRRWVDGEAKARVYEHTVRIVVLEKVAVIDDGEFSGDGKHLHTRSEVKL